MPDGLSMEEGAMLENLGIAVHAVEDFDHDPGNLAVVIGAGPIGIMAAQTLEAWGQRVAITDLVPFRVAMAREVTSAEVLDGKAEDVRGAIADLSGGKGADFVLEAAATQSALDLALDIVKPRGTVSTIGTFDADVTFNPFFKMTRKEVRLQSRMGRSWETWRRVTQLVRDRRVSLKPDLPARRIRARLRPGETARRDEGPVHPVNGSSRRESMKSRMAPERVDPRANMATRSLIRPFPVSLVRFSMSACTRSISGWPAPSPA